MSKVLKIGDEIVNTAFSTAKEGVQIAENTGKFANVLITGTTENVEAATKLTAAGMTVTKDNLVAASKLSVAGMDVTKDNLVAASKLSVAGMDVTKDNLVAASKLSVKGIEITAESVDAASKVLNTSTNIANNTLGTLGQMTDTGLKVASTLSDAIGSMITGSVSAVGKKIKQKQIAYAAANAAQQKQLEMLNNTDEKAKKDALNNLRDSKINDFINIITGINNDIDQLQKTISFSLEQVQKIVQEQKQCKIGSLGIFKRKCTDEEVKEIYEFEAKIRPVKKQMLGDFLKLKTEISSKQTLFNSKLNSIINNVNYNNKSTLHNIIQVLITSLTDTIPVKLTELSEKYNKKITELSNAIFGDDIYEPLTSAAAPNTDIVSDSKTNGDDSSLEVTPQNVVTAGGRKQTRRKNRRTKKTSRRHKKTSRRHKKRTHKRAHF